MSDLISREEILNYAFDDNPYYKYVLVDDIKAIPSADILDHARAIKENCKGKCDTCPFSSANFLGCSVGRPMYWDLPEGEKGKAESIDPNDMTRMFEGLTEIPKDALKGWAKERPLKQIRAESEDK